MSLVEQFHAAHKERFVRLSRRAPEAGPMRIKAKPRIIWLDRNGNRIEPQQPKPLPKPLPPPPKMPQATIQGNVSVAQIIFAVACAFNMDQKWVIERTTRCYPVVLARHVAFYLCRELTGHSLAEIGRRMGGFDHSTTLHGIRRIKRINKDDAKLADMIGRLQTFLLEDKDAPINAQSFPAAGRMGATFHTGKRKWRSQIQVGKNLVFLGYFDTADEAHAAYTRAAEQHFRKFSGAV